MYNNKRMIRPAILASHVKVAPYVSFADKKFHEKAQSELSKIQHNFLKRCTNKKTTQCSPAPDTYIA